MEQNKKTMRHFYCRDVLWDTFEQMANDFDCSIDYLINEAMRYYARSKSYATQGSVAYGAQNTAPPPPAPPPVSEPMGTASTRGSRRPPPPPSGSAASFQDRRTDAHPELSGGIRHRQPSRPVAQQTARNLILIFNNQHIPIEKDQFIIGRGSRSSDLAIKDGNISRKHAAIIQRNGTYYIKDLGSTNGIDYKGMRIDNKRIDDGDVFHLCDYELRFAYSE